MPIRDKILKQLQQHKELTPLELEILTNSSPSGLRGRIAELRRLGYKIDLVPVTTKKYILQENNTNAQNIYNWVVNNNLIRKPIAYETISKQLNLPLEAVTTAMILLHKNGRLQQLSNHKAIVL